MLRQSLFVNALVFQEGKLLQKTIAVKEGVFVDDYSMASPIDLSGYILAPGFIDLQVHGGFGVDLSNSIDMLSVVQKALPKTGVTSFLASLVSLDKMSYLSLPKMTSREGSCCLGFHLEGPILNTKRSGAHDAAALHKGFDKQFWSAILGSQHRIKMVTLAPEIEGAIELTAYLVAHSIRVSIGHTEATEEELIAAVAAGVTSATHLYNAMRPFHHRHPGLIDFVLGNKNLMYTLIADGIHVSDMALKLAYNAHSKGAILISDASALMGFEGAYAKLGNQEIISYKDGSYLNDSKTIAGATSTLHHNMCHFIKVTGCSIAEALEMVTTRPARYLGIDGRKGSITTGADADFVLLDPENGYELVATFISGELFYKNTNYDVDI